jgi:hypothetical protein
MLQSAGLIWTQFMRHLGNAMNLSYVHKLLLAADPFSVIRTNFRAWGKKLPGKNGKTRQPKPSPARHLTSEQREEISSGLQDSVMGHVSMTAAASDTEAVRYEGEIADVLEGTGFDVNIDNAKTEVAEQQVPPGVEMTIKETTVRPGHAYWIVRAFRSAGVAIATRINEKRRKNDTLYITVGQNSAPAVVPTAIRSAAKWQSNVLRNLLKKWKIRFTTGLRRPGQID